MHTRRGFLADVGMGFTGLALGSMLFQDGVARAAATSIRTAPHFPAKAKRVIWLFMVGGRQPRRELRPQAGAEQVRRQDDRGVAVQGRRSTRRT